MTPQFKEECKNSANCNRLGKVFYDTDKEISYDNTLASLEFVEDCYVNGSVLGTVNTKGLTVNTIGKEDLYNKDIDAKIGVKYGDSSEEYINIGKYTVDKPNDQETANLGQYKAYDYLDKLNEDYACNITDWTDITVADIYEDLCEQSGLTPETLEFDNSDIPVTGDIFEEGYKRKDILSDIAELAGSFVDIDKDTNVVKLKRLETNVENTVSGNSDIYIDDALNHSIYDMKIDGNTSQKTTTGKNLYKPTKTDFSNGGVNVTIEENVITLNGEMTVNLVDINIGANVEIEANQYYKLSYHVLGGTGKISHVHSELKVGDEQTWGWLSSRQVAKSSSEAGILDKMIIYCNEKATFNNYQIVIQVEKVDSEDSQATDYEEYTGGEASPNPDYPQTIETISGEIKLKQFGQNLFNIASRKAAEHYPEVSVDEDDWITSSYDNTNGERTRYSNFFTENLYLKPNTNYAIILEVKEASGTGTLTLMSNDGDTGQFKNVVILYDIGAIDNNSVLIYIEKTKESFEKSTNGMRGFIATRAGESNSITFRISVIENTEITKELFKYKPYELNEYTIDLQSNELVKLSDDTKDTIEIGKSGNVILEKNIRHLSLAIKDMDGSSTYPGWNGITTLKEDYPGLNDLLGSHAVYKSNITNNQSAIAINTLSTNAKLFFRRSVIPLTQEEWIAQYPELILELYYSLQNTETINLGTIQNFKTFEGINHFFLETNIDTDFEITYAQDIHNVSLDPVVKLTKDNYSSLTKNQKYGPVNSLVIKESEAEGENVSLQDDNSIAINGETQVNIVDNIFLYTPELRQQVIDKIWDAVSGLTYYDCKIESYTGLPYLNKGDRISIEDDSGNYFDTYVLKHTFTYDGTFKSVIESPALTLQETKIKSPVSLGQMLTQTRINVDKANKNINLLNSQVSDTNSKIAEINIDLSEISQSVVEINNENASIKESLNDYATNDTVTQQINSVEQKITSNNLKIDVIEETLENGVSKVKTETGFTFDNNGLNISSSDSKVNNTLSEIGMEIEDNSTGETLLFAGFDNELQETVVISKNLTVEKYLNIPHARFEGYDNPNHGVGTGCFYIE